MAMNFDCTSDNLLGNLVQYVNLRASVTLWQIQSPLRMNAPPLRESPQPMGSALGMSNKNCPWFSYADSLTIKC